MRTFISLNLDFNTRKKISEIKNEIKEKISAVNPGFLNSIKWEDESKYHVTLYFIGDTDFFILENIHLQLQRLSAELMMDELNFSLKNVNAFPNLKFPRVLTLELENKDRKVFILSDKLKEITEKSGFTSGKDFHPHITLGRIKRDKKLDLTELKNFPVEEVKFYLNKFYLMESKLNKAGSEYKVIREYSV